MSFDEISIIFSAVDNVSNAISGITSSINAVSVTYEDLSTKTATLGNSMSTMETQTVAASVSAKDLAVGFSGVATSAFSLYLSLDRVDHAQVSLDRANLMVNSSLNSLSDAQRRYNAALESGNPEKIAIALSDLNVAQERYTVSVERAELAANNLTNSMISGVLMVVPSLITMISSVSKATEGWTFAQTALNTIMNMNPIYLVAAAVAGLTLALATGMVKLDDLRDRLLHVGDAAEFTVKSLDEANQKIIRNQQDTDNTLLQMLRGAGYMHQQVTAYSVEEKLKILEEGYAAEEKKLQDHFDIEYQDFITFYQDQFGTQETELDKLLGVATAYYDKQISDEQSAYDTQIRATNTFYDELLAAANVNLTNIRAARSAELDDLELNMLLEKEVLEQAHNAGTISTEEYNTRVAEIEKTYRDKRSVINDDYRIKELQEEKKVNEETTTINLERATKIEGIDQTHSTTVQGIEQTKSDKIVEITSKDKELRNKLQDDIAAYEKQKEDEMAANSKTFGEGQKTWFQSVGDTIGSAWSSFARNMTDTWNWNVLQITNDAAWLRNGISDAVNGCIDKINEFVGGVVKGMTDAANAIWDFITHICFYHAIQAAVDGSVKELDIWVDTIQSSMAQGLEAIHGFAGPTGTPSISQTFTTKEGGGSAGASVITINAPITIQGNADRKTAELAAELIMKRVRSIVGT